MTTSSLLVADRLLTYAELLQADLRVGRVLSAQRIPQARKKLYEVRIDIGRFVPEVRAILSEITGLKDPTHQLPGLLVVVGCGIQPRSILGRVSEGLLLTAYCDPEHRQGSMPILAPEGAPVGSQVR